MTNEQILKKAIEKAEKNGYKFEYNLKACQYNSYYYSFIFSHDFAKAFWNLEGEYCPYCKSKNLDALFGGSFPYRCKDCRKDCHPDTYFCWQHHLQQLVLEEEPLLYLERFL